MFGAEQRDQTILRDVDVLILIDQDVFELVLILLAHGFVALEQIDRANDEVVEVQAVRLAQTPLVLGVDVGHPLAEERSLLLVELVGPNQRVLRLADFVQACARRELALIVIEIVENIFHELALIRIVDDRKARRDAALAPVAAQNAHAHRVERSDPEIARRGTDHALEPRLHFARGLVGKGHRKDAIRSNFVLSEQQGNAVREHTRLAASGTGEYQNGTIGLPDGGSLHVVEDFRFQEH